MEIIMMKRDYGIFQDWKANSGNAKGRIVMCLFRIASLIKSSAVSSVIFFWYLVIYRFFVEWVLSIELHWGVEAGPGLKLYHGQGGVITSGVIIGKDCTIRHLTTISNKKLSNGTYSNSPHLGNNVNLGANVTIIGSITIEDNAIIGAGSVITKNVPANSVVVGNPARILKTRYDYPVEDLLETVRAKFI
jgi:putative colanic acid biosynthesis acetyltransferase WcaB